MRQSSNNQLAVTKKATVIRALTSQRMHRAFQIKFINAEID